MYNDEVNQLIDDICLESFGFNKIGQYEKNNTINQERENVLNKFLFKCIKDVQKYSAGGYPVQKNELWLNAVMDYIEQQDEPNIFDNYEKSYVKHSIWQLLGKLENN